MISAMTFEGGAELAANLNRLSKAVKGRVLREATLEALEPMRRAMATSAPREPGAPDLADHMVISRINKIGTPEGGRWEARTESQVAMAVGPAKEYFYGLFQEYGTVFHGAQPFARPAFDGNHTRALDILLAAFWRELAARGMHRAIATLPTSVQSLGGRTL